MLELPNYYIWTVLKNWWIIVLSAFSAVVVSLIVSSLMTPTYRSSASYIIGPTATIENHLDELRSLDTLERAFIIATYAEIFSSDQIFSKAVDAMEQPPRNLSEYDVSAVILPETNILRLTVTGPNPGITALLTMTIGQQAIEFTKNVYQVYDVTLLDGAQIPRQPISPNPSRNAGVAFVLGLALGFALVILRIFDLLPIIKDKVFSKETTSIQNEFIKIKPIEEGKATPQP